VGITNNFLNRGWQHFRGPYGQTIHAVEQMIEGLTRPEARAVEQALIERYGLQRYGGLLWNQINSIAPWRVGYYEQQVALGNAILQRHGL
jgi:hypothetical protein